MRASTAISLLLVSSASVFGFYGTRAVLPLPPDETSSSGDFSTAPDDTPAIEPVWINGVEGVYDPDSNVFVPSTWPNFDEVCDRIIRRRYQTSGGSYFGVSHHWYYSPSFNSYTFAGGGGGGGGASGARSSTGGSSGGRSASVGSARGGIGGHGAAHGGTGG
jgi:hypothetical protein